jgi:predicted SprT family Zn-dependent metalloprotease
MATDPVQTEIRCLLRRWGDIWGVPELAGSVEIGFSSRLRRSLGRCRPAAGRISLHSDLQHSLRHRFPEVLCHEAAHIAVYKLFGVGARPHGAEWATLVEAAGFEASTHSTEPLLPHDRPPAFSGVLEYEHRCPVCHAVRFARRPVPRWRCAECLESGLSGEFVVTHRPRRAVDNES